MVIFMNLHLDEDLPAELLRRRKLLSVALHWLGEQLLSKHLFEVRGHVPLLDHTAVVLDRQDHRVAEENSTGPGKVPDQRFVWINGIRSDLDQLTPTLRRRVL